MTAGARGDRWAFAVASAIGTSHTRTGAPCQDSALCHLLEDRDGNDVLFAAASDGAGSAERSKEGSQFVCDYFRNEVCKWMRDSDLSQLTAELVQQWLRSCRLSLQTIAEDAGLRVRDYACTLLVAVVGPKTAAFFQIGDGAIVTAGGDGGAEYQPVFWPQMGEYANSTNFSTDDDAAESLNFGLEDSRIDEVALFTDGIQAMVLHYATQTAHAPFFDRMLGEVRKEVAPGMSERLSAALQQFLQSEHVNQKTDDDKTLILATRRTANATNS